MPTRTAVLTASLCFATAFAVRAAEFRPVTDAMLRKPDAADWLMWRRTFDAWGYSPLDKINRSGLDSLTPREHERLAAAQARLARRYEQQPRA